MIIEIKLILKGETHTISNKDTTSTIENKLGTPDDKGGQCGKRKMPQIWLYDKIEFHFDLNGKLSLIYQDTNDGIVKIAIPFYKSQE